MVIGVTDNWSTSNPECGEIFFKISFANNSVDTTGIFEYSDRMVKINTSDV